MSEPTQPFKVFTSEVELKQWEDNIRTASEAVARREYEQKLGDAKKEYFAEIEGVMTAIGIDPKSVKGIKSEIVATVFNNLKAEAEKAKVLEEKVKGFDEILLKKDREYQVDSALIGFKDKLSVPEKGRDVILSAAKNTVFGIIEKGDLNPKTNKPYTVQEAAEKFFTENEFLAKPTTTANPKLPNNLGELAGNFKDSGEFKAYLKENNIAVGSKEFYELEKQLQVK